MVAIVQQNSGTFTSATGFTVTLPAATTAGNLIVVRVAANTTVTTPSGFTQRDAQVNFMGDYLYEKAADGLSSWAFTNASGSGTWYAEEILTGAYLAKANSPTTGDTGSTSGTTQDSGSATPTAGHRLLMAFVESINTAAVGTPRTHSGWTGGFTEVADIGTTTPGTQQSPCMGVASLEVDANGSTAYTTTATLSASSEARSGLLAVYSAGGGSGTSFTPSPSDPVGITDAVTTVVSAVRSQADPVGITDSVSASFGTTVAPADPVGITDSVAVTRSVSITIGDNIGITDTGAPQSIDFGIDLADPVGITDGTALLQSLGPIVSDPVGVTDAVTVTQSLARSITDPVGIADSLSASGTGTSSANPADPLGITDLLTATADVLRGAADQLGITDSVSVNLVGAGAVNPSDPVGISDAVTVVRSVLVPIGDGIGITDQAGRVAVLDRSIADPVGIRDAAGNSVGIPPNVVLRIRERSTTLVIRERSTTLTIRERD